MATRNEAEAVRGVIAEIHALSSKMQIVAQRMKIIEKNEQIIGKTLISHNRALKELERRLGAGAGARAPEGAKTGALPEDLEKLKLDVAALQEEIKELKYVIEQINPVEYVTTDEVSELIDERLGKIKGKKK